jgi:hypothetical protein
LSNLDAKRDCIPGRYFPVYKWLTAQHRDGKILLFGVHPALCQLMEKRFMPEHIV